MKIYHSVLVSWQNGVVLTWRHAVQLYYIMKKEK